MAGKSRPSAEKRRIDKERQEKQAAKRERRHNREAEEGDGSDGPSSEELMERFRVLSEAHASGKVTDEEFGPARHELMVALGVEDPVDTPED